MKVVDTKKEIPLSSRTNSGKLISQIEEKNQKLSYYKTNLVKCLPLEENKIRYPKTHEMESCFDNLSLEIKKSKPQIVFLLGKAVSDFIMNAQKSITPFLDENFEYKSHKINDIHYIPIHHPSYILVYKRKFLNKYTSKISNLMANLASC